MAAATAAKSALQEWSGLAFLRAGRGVWPGLLPWPTEKGRAVGDSLLRDGGGDGGLEGVHILAQTNDDIPAKVVGLQIATPCFFFFFSFFENVAGFSVRYALLVE